MLIKYIVISAIFILFGFFAFRVIVRNDYLNKLKLSPFSYSLEVIVFAVHVNLIYLFIPAKWPHLPYLPENQTLLFFSIILLGLGMTILLISWFGLGSGISFGLDKNKLKTTGLYRYSRNPQLVGYGTILLGFALVFISWYSLGWFVQYLIISYFMIRSEEEFLSLRYGEEYEKYCRIVPRII